MAISIDETLRDGYMLRDYFDCCWKLVIDLVPEGLNKERSESYTGCLIAGLACIDKFIEKYQGKTDLPINTRHELEKHARTMLDDATYKKVFGKDK